MPRKQLSESIRSMAKASRLARFNLVKVLSYHFNSVLSHAHGSLSRQIDRYCALRGHAETFAVRRAPARVVSLLCQASCSALLMLGMKAFHFRRKESFLDCPHCTDFQIDMPLAQLAAFFMFRTQGLSL